MASPPRMTVKLSHERKVRSLAKKTLGSTRVGRAMRLPGVVEGRFSSGIDTLLSKCNGVYEGKGPTWGSLKKRL